MASSFLFTSTCLGACQALPPPSGNIVVVDSEVGLWNAVNSAISGDTILVADGTYNLGSAGYYLWIDVPGITIRSQSGSPEAVVFDDNYLGSEIITVLASNVTIANLTIKHARTHAIHVTSSASADTINTLIYNVRIIDPGQQAIKINPSNGSYFTDYGEIACSVIELTESGRTEVFDYNGSCYTGGVDGHQSRGWVVRDNTIEGFWCDDDLSEHGVHFWTGSRDTLVERNTFINNARGVGFGLQQNGTGRTYSDTPCPGATGHVGHFEGIIRNNFFFATDPSLFASEYGADTGIALAQACGAQIIHNSLAFTDTPFNAIEYRFINTQAIIVNNLATHNILQRQDASADLAGNLQYQPLTIFKNGTSGDLHISQTSTAAIDQGVSVSAGLCDDDIDGEPRPVGDARDIGADEYVASLVALGDVNNDGLVNLKDAILSLRVAAGVDVTGGLTVKSDVSDDQKIGLEEAIFVLDEVSKQ